MIVVDADVLGRNRTGEETYVLNLLRQLPFVAPDLTFAAVTRRPDLVPEGVEPLELPARFHGGALEVRGGVPPEGCPYCGFGETFRTTAKTFAQLVAQFQNGEHTNDLIARTGKARTTVQEPNQIFGSRTIELVVG